MGKIPFMPFDVLAWFSSGTVSAMTNAEEGIYARLLLHAWNHPECTLPPDVSEVRRLAKNAPLKTVQKILDKCFTKTSHGYRNEKNYRVWLHAIKVSSIASGKAKRMHNLRKTKILDDAAAQAGAHAPNDAKVLLDACKQKQKQNKTFKTFCDSSIELHLAQGLLSEILKWKPNLKKPNLQTWAKSIDGLMRIDNRTPDEIEKVIVWCQKDTFWKANILSAAKLREQFDQLQAKMLLEKGGPNGKPRDFAAERESQTIDRIKRVCGLNNPVATDVHREESQRFGNDSLEEQVEVIPLLETGQD